MSLNKFVYNIVSDILDRSGNKYDQDKLEQRISELSDDELDRLEVA